MLSIAVLIFILAYWTTRWIASHGAPGPSGWSGGERFRVLSRLFVGRGAELVIVRVGERCLLLSVTEHQIALLKEWEGDDADAWLTESTSDNAFLNALRDALQQRTERRPRRK